MVWNWDLKFNKQEKNKLSEIYQSFDFYTSSIVKKKYQQHDSNNTLKDYYIL
jgi:hypothetical protein